MTADVEVNVTKMTSCLSLRGCATYVAHTRANHCVLFDVLSALMTSCRRAAATICPRPLPPSVGTEAPRGAEPTAAPADGK